VETVPQTVSIRHMFIHKKSPLPKITRTYRGGRSIRLPWICHWLTFGAQNRYRPRVRDTFSRIILCQVSSHSDQEPHTDTTTPCHTHTEWQTHHSIGAAVLHIVVADNKWVSEWVGFNVPINTRYVISETSLSSQSVALILSVYWQPNKNNYETEHTNSTMQKDWL